MSNVNALLNLLDFAETDAITLDHGPMTTDWHASAMTGNDKHVIARITEYDDDSVNSYSFTEGAINAGHFDEDGTFYCNDVNGYGTTLKFYKMRQISLHQIAKQ
jgi:hypothetical protein